MFGRTWIEFGLLLSFGLSFWPAILQRECARRCIVELGSEDPVQRDAASGRLIQLGEQAVPLLQAALQSSDWEVKDRAGWIIQRIHKDREMRESARRVRRLFEFWPGGTYDFYAHSGVKYGRLTIKNERGTCGSEEVLKCTTRYRNENGDAHFETTQTLLCRLDPYLTPLHLCAREVPVGRSVPTFLDTDLHSIDVPRPFATDMSLLHLVTNMPFAVEATLHVHVLVGDGLPEKYVHDETIRCVGPEDVTIGDRKIRSWKFVSEVNEHEVHYWISEDRIFLKCWSDYGSGLVRVDAQE